MSDNDSITPDSPSQEKIKSKSNKLPAFQFYPGDWHRDAGIQSLGFFDRGVWFEILLLMHDSSERGVLLLNNKPMSETVIANCLGLDKQILTTALNTLLENGVAHRREDGAIYNKRMIRDEEIRQIRKEAGLMGGNPRLLKQIPTTGVKQIPTTGVKQIPTPSSSSSSSSSISSSEEVKTAPQAALTPTPPIKKSLKEEKAKFNPEGKTKYLDWVYLSQEQFDRVRAYYKERNLDREDFDEAVRALDSWFADNPKMRPKRTDDARTLIGWPLDRAIERKKKLMALERQSTFNNGAYK